MKKTDITLTADEVDTIKDALNFAFETGYSDKGVALIESVAALTTIDAVLTLAIKRERKEGAEK